MRRPAALIAIALLATAGIGCATPDTAGNVRLRVENLTDTPVGVYVDGDWIGTDEPGATVVTVLEPTDAEAYRIEARSPSGAVLAAVDAPALTVEDLREGRGDALGEDVGLPCGVIRFVIGEPGANRTPTPPAAVAPGPCP